MLNRIVTLCFVILAMCVGSIGLPAHSMTHGISIFGDYKYSKDFKHFDYVNPNASKGGQIKLASIGTFDNLNPFILKGMAATGTELLFDTLTVSSADEAGVEYGLLAKHVELPDHRQWIIFTLREEARWHDGLPVTANDVVFSFNTLIEKGHPHYRIYYQDVEKAEKLSVSKVKFTFKSTENRELPLIVGQLPILSKQYYQTHPFDQTTLNTPMGSGPYTIDSVEAGRSITYKRAPNYWAKDLPVNVGRYNFDSIRFDYYRDSTVAVEALKAGEYDFRRENISKTWAKAYNIPHIKDGRMTKEELADGTPTGMQCFVMNLRLAKFQDIKVRQALNYAYDFQWANKQLFFSAYQRNTSFFSNSDYASTPYPSEAEKSILTPYKDHFPESVFNRSYRLPRTEGTGLDRSNLIKAQTLLDEAGWPIKNKIRIDPSTGQQAEIEFLLVSPSFERVVAPFIRSLKKLGIKGTIRTVDSTQYIKRRENFDYDIIVHWYTQSNAPGNEQVNYWHSESATKPGSMNLIGIQNPAVDAMVDRIISAQDRSSLITATRALDRILLWNYYVIPQWHSRTHRVIYWNKLARPNITAPYSLGLIDRWWIQ